LRDEGELAFECCPLLTGGGAGPAESFGNEIAITDERLGAGAKQDKAGLLLERKLKILSRFGQDWGKLLADPAMPSLFKT